MGTVTVCFCMSLRTGTLFFLTLYLTSKILQIWGIMLESSNIKDEFKNNEVDSTVMMVSVVFSALCIPTASAAIVAVAKNEFVITILTSVVVLLEVELLFWICVLIPMIYTSSYGVIIFLTIVIAMAFILYATWVFCSYMEILRSTAIPKIVLIKKPREVCCCMSVSTGAFFSLFFLLFDQMFEMCWYLRNSNSFASYLDIIPTMSLIIHCIGFFIIVIAIVALILDESILALRVVTGFLVVDLIFTLIVGIYYISNNYGPVQNKTVFVSILLPFILISLKMYTMKIFSYYKDELKHPGDRMTTRIDSPKPYKLVV